MFLRIASSRLSMRVRDIAQRSHLPRFLDNQLRLEADAREALPYVRSGHYPVATARLITYRASITAQSP